MFWDIVFTTILFFISPVLAAGYVVVWAAFCVIRNLFFKIPHR